MYIKQGCPHFRVWVPLYILSGYCHGNILVFVCSTKCVFFYIAYNWTCVGVQVLLRDYDFSLNPVFTDDDITAVYPIITHTNFRVSPTVSCLFYIFTTLFVIISQQSRQQSMKWHFQSLALVYNVS